MDGGSFLSDLKNAMGMNLRVSITSTAARCALPVAQAIPLALIVNELVTNALKHGFPRGRSGTIRVILDKHTSNELALTVADDGVGLRGQHLRIGTGQTLLAHLTEQLGGRLECKSSSTVASFRVTFPCCGPSLGALSMIEAGTLH